MSKSAFMELMDAFFDFREKMKGEAIPIFSEKVKGYRFTCLKKQGINQVSFKMIGDGEFVYKWRYPCRKILRYFFALDFDFIRILVQ